MYKDCRVLAVHPDYHRRGLGQLLLAEGLDAADAAEAQAFIEASDKGYWLYRKLGWEDVDELAVDVGGGHVEKMALMIRQPKFAERSEI